MFTHILFKEVCVMRKRLLIMAMAGLMLAGFTACSESNADKGDVLHADELERGSIVENELAVPDWGWSENVARRVTDDGWVYTFNYTYNEFGVEEEDLIQYTFAGVNLRHKYSDAYYEFQVIEPKDPSMVTEILPRNMLSLGSPEYPELNRDMDKIMKILDYGKHEVTRQELLGLKPEDVEFEQLDKDMFFSLMHEALTGEAHATGPYGMLQNNGIVEEDKYSENYKFQVGYASAMGVLDIVYIDVLYKTGDRYNDYVQLSDIVKEEKATPEQMEAYELIQSIEKGIVEENKLMYGLLENEDKVVGGIDFYRLYKLFETMQNQ